MMDNCFCWLNIDKSNYEVKIKLPEYTVRKDLEVNTHAGTHRNIYLQKVPCKFMQYVNKDDDDYALVLIETGSFKVLPLVTSY